MLWAALGCGGQETARAIPSTDGGSADATQASRDAAAMDSPAAGSPDAGHCADGGRTSISGRVYDPANANPLYNVKVFVPAGPLAVLPSGASCEPCNLSLYSPAAAWSLTDAEGKFRIEDPPTGAAIPLVVQAGKWRKRYVIDNVAACQDNPQPDRSLRLPRSRAEGDLPQIAVSTGGEDSLECLLLRTGIAPSEYVGGAGAPSGGHVHIFSGHGGAITRGRDLTRPRRRAVGQPD